MDINELVLNVSDAFGQLYNIVARKPFLTVRVSCPPPQKDSAEPAMTLTIVNESSFDMEAQRIWFLTSYNRIVSAESLDAGLPVKLPENDRVTYPVPVAELKAALNKAVGDTIDKVIVLDKNGRQNSARFSQAAQKEFLK